MAYYAMQEHFPTLPSVAPDRTVRLAIQITIPLRNHGAHLLMRLRG